MKKSLLTALFAAFSGSLALAGSISVAKAGNLREGPSTKSKIVGQLTPGEAVEELESSGGWFKVELPDGKIGWSHNSLFKASPRPPEESAAPNKTKAAADKPPDGGSTAVGAVGVSQSVSFFADRESVTISGETIRVGMTKKQVLQKAKKIGIEIEQETPDRWLLSMFVMEFEKGKLASFPEIRPMR